MSSDSTLDRRCFHAIRGPHAIRGFGAILPRGVHAA